MPTWKRMLLKAGGFGAGTVFALTIVTALFFWYTSRPPKRRPWNRGAITAEFYRLSTVGEGDPTLEFEYVLDNNTEQDYELATHSAPKIAAKLEDSNSLTGFADENALVLKLPIFVPAHQKTRISVTMPGYSFPTVTRPTASSTSDEWHKYHAEVAAHVTTKMSNLSGFVLFDENSRYQVELPNGWKKQTEENDRKIADKETIPQKQ
jgi:hypothetical protein